MNRPPEDRRWCDPEEVFALAEGVLPPEREAQVREHLGRCLGCRELYERELSLTAYLGSEVFADLRACRVSNKVAMALSTRSVGARVLWAMLALGLLLVTLLALGVNGINPLILVVDAVTMLGGLVAGLDEAARAVFAVAGSTLLVAFVVGALLDLLIAAAVIAAAARRS